MGQTLFISALMAGWLGLLPARAVAQPTLAPASPALARAWAVGSRPGSHLVTANGMVEASYTWPLVASNSGWVKQVFFRPGDYVRHRQILLKFLHNPAYTSSLNREYLMAPRAGLVVKNNVAVGRLVRAGMCVAVLQDVSCVQVRLRVPPRVGQALRPHDQATVQVTELPGRSFVGLVEQVSTPGSGPAATEVVVTVRNVGGPHIRPRMHARVLLETHTPPPAMARR